VTKNNLFKFDSEMARGSCHFCPPLEGGPKSIDFEGGQIIIGTDEAGRGPGAGGVFASAVCFVNPTDANLIKKLSDLNDSKKLSKKKREELYDVILENTINSTVCIEVEEIEKINVLNASLKAMGLAVENVIKEIANCKWKMENGKCHCEEGRSPDAAIQKKSNILILVDGNKLIKEFLTPQKDESVYRLPFTVYPKINQQCIIKGDGKSASIAAASILAKVSRDRYMEELDKKFPEYNWKQNAGYLTAQHLSAIDRYGITPHHRKRFLRKHEAKCNINQLNTYQK
jgi:ribonuclease HII